MGGTAPPTSLLGPFSPMFSKKMLNLKRERPPLLFLAKHHWMLVENLFQLPEDFDYGCGRAAVHYHYLIIYDIIVFTL